MKISHRLKNKTFKNKFYLNKKKNFKCNEIIKSKK